MVEYVSKETLLKAVEKIDKLEKESTPYEYNKEGYILLIESAPTADVAEVKHAKWSHLGGDEWCCTNCGEIITTEGSWEKPTKKFCNECGAKMDGGKEE